MRGDDMRELGYEQARDELIEVVHLAGARERIEDTLATPPDGRNFIRTRI